MNRSFLIRHGGNLVGITVAAAAAAMVGERSKKINKVQPASSFPAARSSNAASCRIENTLSATAPHNFSRNFFNEIQTCREKTKGPCLAFDNRHSWPGYCHWYAAKKSKSPVGEHVYSQKQQIHTAVAFVRQHLNAEVIEKHLDIIRKNCSKADSRFLICYLTPVKNKVDGTHTSKNVLPTTYALLLKNALDEAIKNDPQLRSKGIEVVLSPIKQYSSIKFTEMADDGYDFVKRIFSKPRFGEPVIPAGVPKNKIDVILVAEDDSESGKTLQTLINQLNNWTQYFINRDDRPVVITPSVVVRSPGTRQLQILDSTKICLMEIVRNLMPSSAGTSVSDEEVEREINAVLSIGGESLDRLTNMSALCLVALFLDSKTKASIGIMERLFHDYQIKTGDPLGWITLNAHQKSTGKSHALMKCWKSREFLGNDYRTGWQIFKKFVDDLKVAQQNIDSGSFDEASEIVDFIPEVNQVMNDRLDDIVNIPTAGHGHGFSKMVSDAVITQRARIEQNEKIMRELGQGDSKFYLSEMLLKKFHDPKCASDLLCDEAIKFHDQKFTHYVVNNILHRSYPEIQGQAVPDNIGVEEDFPMGLSLQQKKGDLISVFFNHLDSSLLPDDVIAGIAAELLAAIAIDRIVLGEPTDQDNLENFRVIIDQGKSQKYRFESINHDNFRTSPLAVEHGLNIRLLFESLNISGDALKGYKDFVNRALSINRQSLENIYFDKLNKRLNHIIKICYEVMDDEHHFKPDFIKIVHFAPSAKALEPAVSDMFASAEALLNITGLNLSDCEITRDQKDVDFLKSAYQSARNSNDPSTWVGSVIVRNDGVPLSTGFNHIPDGADLDRAKTDKAYKNRVAIHAETHAINQVRNQDEMKDAIMYMPWVPCENCAKAIIKSALKHW
jgi:dCMP deaminase